MGNYDKIDAWLCAIISFCVAVLLTFRAYRHPDKDVIAQITRALTSTTTSDA